MLLYEEWRNLQWRNVKTIIFKPRLFSLKNIYHTLIKVMKVNMQFTATSLEVVSINEYKYYNKLSQNNSKLKLSTVKTLTIIMSKQIISLVIT